MIDPFIIDKDRYRLTVGLQGDRAYVSVGSSSGGHGIMLDPAEMLAAARHLIDLATAIVDRQEPPAATVGGDGPRNEGAAA